MTRNPYFIKCAQGTREIVHSFNVLFEKYKRVNVSNLCENATEGGKCLKTEIFKPFFFFFLTFQPFSNHETPRRGQIY